MKLVKIRSIGLSDKDMEKINDIKRHEGISSNAAVVRLALFNLHRELKNENPKN